jgi:anion-transporting  ArsA/GET3 family ATPase
MTARVVIETARLTKGYTAIGELYELKHGADYDVIVVDTPPSRHAIDFLDAPDRLIGFLEGRALAVVMRPTGHAIRAAGVAFAGLRRITGTRLLEDLTSFFRQPSELLDCFRRRAADVCELLIDPASAFPIVTSPQRAAVDEALFFAAELDRVGMHRARVIVKRVHPFDPTDVDVAGTAARLAPVLGPSLAERTARTHAELQRLAQRDAAAIARIRSALKSDPVSLAERPSDVHDIPGLMALREELFERDDEHETHRWPVPVGAGVGESPGLQHG